MLHNNATNKAGSPQIHFAALRKQWTSNFMQQNVSVIERYKNYFYASQSVHLTDKIVTVKMINKNITRFCVRNTFPNRCY